MNLKRNIETISEVVDDRGVNVEKDFGYVAEDVWYGRIGAFKKSERSNDFKGQKIIYALVAIAAGDTDLRIRDLADNLLFRWA